MAIELITKIKPKNNGNFTLVDAEDIAYKDGKLTDYMFEALTEAEYNKAVANGTINENTPYLIIEG